jgi:hypothetical protein
VATKNFTILLTTVLFVSLLASLFSLKPVQAEDPLTKKVLVNVRNDLGHPQADVACLVRNADGGTGWIGRTDYNGYVELMVLDSVKVVIVSCYSADGSQYGIVTKKLDGTTIRVIISPTAR